ncbi:hypothetical protein D3C72_1330570 [compost metagenome]
MVGAAGGRVGHEALLQFLEVFDMRVAVGPGDLFQRGQGHLAPRQRVADAGQQQPVFDGIQPLGAFGMPVAHVVLPEVAMREVACLAHLSPCLVSSRLDLTQHGAARSYGIVCIWIQIWTLLRS